MSHRPNEAQPDEETDQRFFALIASYKAEESAQFLYDLCVGAWRIGRTQRGESPQVTWDDKPACTTCERGNAAEYCGTCVRHSIAEAVDHYVSDDERGHCQGCTFGRGPTGCPGMPLPPSDCASKDSDSDGDDTGAPVSLLGGSGATSDAPGVSASADTPVAGSAGEPAPTAAEERTTTGRTSGDPALSRTQAKRIAMQSGKPTTASDGSTYKPDGSRTMEYNVPHGKPPASSGGPMADEDRVRRVNDMGYDLDVDAVANLMAQARAEGRKQERAALVGVLDDIVNEQHEVARNFGPALGEIAKACGKFVDSIADDLRGNRTTQARSQKP